MLEWKTGRWLYFFPFSPLSFITSWKQYISRTRLITESYWKPTGIRRTTGSPWCISPPNSWLAGEAAEVKGMQGRETYKAYNVQERVELQKPNFGRQGEISIWIMLFHHLVLPVAPLPWMCVLTPTSGGSGSQPSSPCAVLVSSRSTENQKKEEKTKQNKTNNSVTQFIWPMEWLHPRFATEGKACTASLKPTSFVTFHLQKAWLEEGWEDTRQCS